MGTIQKISRIQSTAETKDISLDVHLVPASGNVLLRSRMREILTYGSERDINNLIERI